ncbi:O-antigen ligase family protein [Deinococcus sp. KSM4-11]|uniref:O-antigen ligase family protein n=1 Tax=Deinococcus sp. KSM4-11 TaxID=2568654 RepID=UPI0010A39841|nr:O-antigen ligase family protein [Deinococcus sp. KSM4-11]THF84025.1 O-antigen ligase family protein [Deinococcus sp. KSM4-11]
MSARTTSLAPSATTPRPVSLRPPVALLLACVFLFSISWENAVVVSGLGTVGRLTGALAVLGWLTHVLRHGRISRLSAGSAALVVYLLYATATYFVRVDENSAFDTAITTLQLGIVSLLLWDLIHTRTQLMLALVSIVAGASVSAILTILNFLGQQPTRFYDRYAGGNFDPNELGLILSLSVPLAWWLARELRLPLLRAAMLLYPPAALVALILTGSRAALIAYGCALLYVLYDLFFGTTFRKTVRVGLLASLVACGWGVSVLAPGSVARLSTIGTELTRGNLNDRRDIWAAAWTLSGTSPVLGIGVGRLADDLKPYFGQAIVAHNTLITVAVEGGVIGTLLYAAYVALLLLNLRALRGSLWPMWLACLACLAVGTFTLTWNYRKLTWVLPTLALCSARLCRTEDLELAGSRPLPEHDSA